MYFAVSGMGAVLHTINPRLPLDQLRYVVDHAEDVALFFDTTFVKLAQFVAQQPSPGQPLRRAHRRGASARPIPASPASSTTSR